MQFEMPYLKLDACCIGLLWFGGCVWILLVFVQGSPKAGLAYLATRGTVQLTDSGTKISVTHIRFRLRPCARVHVLVKSNDIGI